MLSDTWPGPFASCAPLAYLLLIMTTPEITAARIHAALAGRTRRILPLGGLKHAGVLVPLLLSGPLPELLFTKRTEIVETHKGQVSFPGGVAEPADRDIVETSLREAMEEIGIHQKDISVLGLLDDLATPTGFVITPVVGSIQPSAPLAPNPDEVAQVFQVPIQYFTEPSHARREMRIVRGAEHEVWHYEAEGHTIWGVTASIVRSLLEALQIT